MCKRLEEPPSGVSGGELAVRLVGQNKRNYFRTTISNVKKPLIIYHGRCNDGLCSAWIAKKVFPDADFFPAIFGEDPPDVRGRDVYILDFSYRRPILLEMKEKAKSLMVLDHHKSAAKDLEGLKFCCFDMNKSGAGLAWAYFSHLTYPKMCGGFKSNMPWLVEYVQDKDLWNWSLPNSREINATISSFPMRFEAWDELSKMTPEQAYLEGKPILRYTDRQAELLMNFAREVELDGHKILAVNTFVMCSEVGNKLAEDRPFGAVWFQRDDGKFVYCLRSLPGGLDVSKIAGDHSGGGHARSAGFLSDKFIF